METSSIIPLTQRPQLIATSSFDNKNDNNANEVLEFNKSTKKVDKIVKKINTLNAEKATNKTSEQQQTTNITEPQVIFLDSSNSPNGESIIELNQTQQGLQIVNTPNHPQSKKRQQTSANGASSNGRQSSDPNGTIHPQENNSFKPRRAQTGGTPKNNTTLNGDAKESSQLADIQNSTLITTT